MEILYYPCINPFNSRVILCLKKIFLLRKEFGFVNDSSHTIIHLLK